MSFVSQWTAIADGLPPDWSDAQLLVTVEQDGGADRAAALLGPLNPGRSGRQIRLFCARSGHGVTPEALERGLVRLDRERLLGRLELAGSGRAEATPVPAPMPTLAADWDAALETMPPDWSDMYAELELTSSDHLERVAPLTRARRPRTDPRRVERPPRALRHGQRQDARARLARRWGGGLMPDPVSW